MKQARRIRQLIAANVHALLDRADDPFRALRALLREIDEVLDALEETELELRTTLKLGEQEVARLERRVAARQVDAEALLAAGDEAAARREVEARLVLEAEREAVDRRLHSTRDALERLVVDRDRLRERRDETAGHTAKARSQRSEQIVAKRYRSGADATLERGRERVERIEGRLARLEARVAAYDELSPRVTAREQPTEERAVDEALAALKARR